MKTLLSTLLATLVLALPAAALAQWQWIDNTGRKVFSDQPPPPDVPARNILKQPGPRPAAAATAAAAPPLVPSAAPALKPSGKDTELEQRKKVADAAEAAKKKAEQDRVTAARAENCKRAQQSKTTFDSGMRIATTNAKGEREYMSDEARASETRRLSDIIARDCQS